MAKKYLLLITLVLTFSYLSSFSQEKSENKNMMVSPSGDTLIIKPIPLPEITTSLETANEKIKKIEARLAPGPQLLKFDSVYLNSYDKLILQKEQIQSEDNYFTLRSIDDATEKWTNYNDNTAIWKEIINDRLRTLETDLFDIEVLEAKWNLTIKNAKEGGVPSDVLTTVTDFTRYLLIVKKECSQRKTEALGKQNKLSEVSLIIDDVLSFLELKRKAVQSEYWIQDSPPIWRAKDSTTNQQYIKSQIKDMYSQDKLAIFQFFEANRTRVISHFVIFLVLWLLYYLLHIAAGKMDTENQIDEFDKARTILSHYGMSALIISLFLTIWIYPVIITSISDLIQLAYIIIAIFYLPKFADKRLRPLLIAILVLYIVNDVQLIFYARTFFVRLMQIAETFLAAWILYEMIKPGSYVAEELRHNNYSILIRLIPVFFVLLGASLLGNIFGFVDLSVLLGNTVVNALFNLIILILAIMVVNRTISVLLRTPFLQSSFVIKNHLHDIEKRLAQIFKIVAVLLWLKSILKLLGVYTMLYDWFNTAIETSWQVGSSTIEVGNILSFILVIIITILLYRFVNVVLKEDIFPRVVLPRGIPGTITTVITYLIIGYGTFLAIGAAGVDLGQFGLIAGALGVGIGFGLQGIVANFIAGLVLAFERPIQVGDEIQMTTTMGVVRSIGVRSTVIRTYDGSEVIVPNGDLITKEVINWTLSDRKKRRDIIIGVAYGSNPEIVLDLIRKVANDDPDVLKIPAPWALFDGFGDSSLNFRLRIWTTMDNGVTVRSNVAVEIYEALEKAGIEIPFPQRDLHIKSIEGQTDGKLKTAMNVPPKKRRRKSTKPIEKKPMEDDVNLGEENDD